MEGVDYKDVFAPVVKSESLRVFLSLVAARDMDCIQVDVVSAFLYGSLHETVYMHQPPGYEDPTCPDFVCRLIKNLYGLKQAPRVWHQTIDPALRDFGFQPLVADPCIYSMQSKNGLSFISLYVDDLAVASDSTTEIQTFLSYIEKRFKITSDGDLHHLLGIKITRDRSNRTISLSSPDKITNILKDYNMFDAHPVPTPMISTSLSSSDSPVPRSSDWLSMQSVPYRQCVGRLIHLSRTTRPDTSYPVSVVSRHLANPGKIHWNTVKHILRYLSGTRSQCLTLNPSDMVLSGYCDADWAGNVDTLKSTTGYAFFLGKSLISWCSKAQSKVATSSTHAGYIAAYSASCEAMWLRSLLAELNLLSSPTPTTLHCDNDAAVKIATHHMVTPRSKHFEIKLHALREHIRDGSLSLKLCPGSHNVADFFTKPLKPAKFNTFRSSLGIVPCVST